jgi:hypothetical protein
MELMSLWLVSFPRKRESRDKGRIGRQVWIPACAGMTMPVIPPNRIMLSEDDAFHLAPAGLAPGLVAQPRWRSAILAMSDSPADECGYLHCLLGGAERERNSKSRTTAPRSPPQAAAFQTVLEFEFLSRKIASKPSMERWR